MSSTFFNLIKARRTHYGLSKVSTVSDAKLKSIVEEAVMHIPSPFNIQSGRAVLLTGKSSDKLWDDIVRPGYLNLLGADEGAIEMYTKKIKEYAAGYGTVMFFEDTAVVDGISAKIPTMAKHFPVWSENSTGMLQFSVWTALASEGMGASLQHYAAYSDEIAANVLKEFNLPLTWKCTAMMPFGVATGEPGQAGRPKTFNPIEERFKFFD